MPVCEDDLGSPDETTNETESREPQIKTCPEVSLGLLPIFVS